MMFSNKKTSTLIMSHFLLLAYLSILVYNSSSQPQVFTWPTLNLSDRVDITENVNLNNPSGTTYVSMETTEFYVSRLTNSGKLQIFDIQTNALKFNIFSSINYPSSRPVIFYDFLDKENDTLAILSDNNQGYLYKMHGNGTLDNFYVTDAVSTTFNIRNAIQMMKDQFFLCVTLFGKTTFSRRKKTSGWGLTSSHGTNFLTSSYNMKICQAKLSDSFFRVAIWKRDCYVVVLKCPIASGCSQQFILNNTACSLNQYTSTTRDYFRLSWNSNCTKILFESKNQGLRMVNLLQNLTMTTFPVTSSDSALNGFWFLDDFDKFIGVSKPNGNLEIYNSSSQAILETKVLQPGNVVAFSRLKKDLFITVDEKLLEYKFSCSQANFTLEASGLCVFNESYEPPNKTQNQTDNKIENKMDNQTDDNIDINIEDKIDTQTDNQTYNEAPGMNLDDILIQNIKNITDIITNDPKYLNESKQYLRQSNQTIQQNSTILNYLNEVKKRMVLLVRNQKYLEKPIQYTSSIVKVLPLSSLYLNFINFWSICSMFRIVRITLPHNLDNMLKQIHGFANSSIFQNLHFKFNFQTKFDEKIINQLDLNDGISSDFINSNFQTLLMLFVSYIVLGLLYFVQTKLPQNNFIGKKFFSINYWLVFLGQYVGIMSTFLFNLPIITGKAYQKLFVEKLNMVLHNLFFVFSIFISCLVILIISKGKKKTKTKRKDKEKLKKLQLSWFFDIQCNCLLAILTILRIIPLFLIFNMVFFCIPIYLAWKEKKCKVIAVIKSMYLQLLNLGVAILAILNLDIFRSDLSSEISNIVSIFSSCIIGIGAAHEVLQLVVKIVYNIYVFIRHIRKKFVSIQDQQIAKRQSQAQDLSNFQQVLQTNPLSPDNQSNKGCLQTFEFVQQTKNNSSQIQINKLQKDQLQNNGRKVTNLNKTINFFSNKGRVKLNLKKFIRFVPESKTAINLDNAKLKIVFKPSYQLQNEKQQFDSQDDKISQIVQKNHKMQINQNIFQNRQSEMENFSSNLESHNQLKRPCQTMKINRANRRNMINQIDKE